ncbi:hypothetical protein [Paenibacillus tengchongensis]|uniref:hypothetical protein n=1 Tax=Paenibacillus tengchongensis TaxID=2608684 RepID=UPI00124F4807|nr:hypothetical protein [Paenibacillus tengchongensis]
MKGIIRTAKPFLSPKVFAPDGSLPAPKAYVYRDPKFGFSMIIPGWWQKYSVIERSPSAGDADYGVFFLFKYKGKTYGDVFSLLVFRMSLQRWINESYDDSPYVRLATRDGLIFAYTTPGELPEEFLDETGNDYDDVKYALPIRLMSRMVNGDAPKIARSLKLAAKPSRKQRKHQPMRSS